MIILITSKMEDPATPYLRIVSGSKDFTHFKPKTPQYKKLKNGKIVSLTLKITDQNNNIVTNGPGTTVVLHFR